MTNCFLQHFQGTTSIFILCVHLCVDGDPSCASDFLFLCGQEPSAVWTGDWVTARDWQAGLRRGMEAACCPWHDRTKLWVNVWRWICRRRGVEVTERLIKRPLSAPPPIPRWVSAPSAPLQPGPKRNRYSCLLPGHVDLSQPCLQGLGGGPLTYYLVLASLSLSQRDLHQRALSAGLFYIHSGCVGLLLCLAFGTMRGVLSLFLKAT